MRVVTNPPSFLQAPHVHDVPRLIVYLDGVYVERSLAERAVFRRGDFCMRPHWYVHDGASSDGAAYTHLPVSELAARRFFALKGWRALRGEFALDRLQDLKSDPAAGDVLLTTARVQPLEENFSDALHPIARELDSESERPLECIAESGGFSPWALCRRFTRVFGMTPSSFRLSARLKRAMRLLAETDASIAAVAAQTGFTDQSHFVHSVRRLLGVTPSAARAKISLA
jgi:AraC-like DNA-binding protein